MLRSPSSFFSAMFLASTTFCLFLLPMMSCFSFKHPKTSHFARTKTSPQEAGCAGPSVGPAPPEPMALLQRRLKASLRGRLPGQSPRPNDDVPRIVGSSGDGLRHGTGWDEVMVIGDIVLIKLIKLIKYVYIYIYIYI